MRLQMHVQEARKTLHQNIIDRFDADVPLEVKQFWFISAMLDPRFKKLSFDGDRMLKAHHRRDAARWFSEEYNSKYKGKFYNASAEPEAQEDDAAAPPRTPTRPEQPAPKRRKVSASSFFAPRAAGTAAQAPSRSSPRRRLLDTPYDDELTEYLALPQIEFDAIADPLEWWKEHAKRYPNLSIMARQYLACPATSATVERLFSKVGIAYAKKRQSAGANTIADLIFTEANVD